MLRRAKQPCKFSRVVLATNLAENSITLADIDIVIDLGKSRHVDEYQAVLEVEDRIITQAQSEQRRGRVGRTKPGCCIRLEIVDVVLPKVVPRCSDELCRVIALSDFHAKIAADKLTFCTFPDHLLTTARDHLSSLKFSEENLKIALTKLPLSLKDAATLLRGLALSVGYEAACPCPVHYRVEI